MEWQGISDTRVREAREQMQIEIEKLKLEISICYEKLSRKDADNRKLIIQLEELKEWRIKFEEIKKQHAVEI